LDVAHLEANCHTIYFYFPEWYFDLKDTFQSLKKYNTGM